MLGALGEQRAAEQTARGALALVSTPLDFAASEAQLRAKLTPLFPEGPPGDVVGAAFELVLARRSDYLHRLESLVRETRDLVLRTEAQIEANRQVLGELLAILAAEPEHLPDPPDGA